MAGGCWAKKEKKRMAGRASSANYTQTQHTRVRLFVGATGLHTNNNNNNNNNTKIMCSKQQRIIHKDNLEKRKINSYSYYSKTAKEEAFTVAVVIHSTTRGELSKVMKQEQVVAVAVAQCQTYFSRDGT